MFSGRTRRFPWVLFFFLSALETGALQYAVGAAAAIAVSIYAGGTHITFILFPIGLVGSGVL
jgi:hypothetical protein